MDNPLCRFCGKELDHDMLQALAAELYPQESAGINIISTNSVTISQTFQS